MNPDSLFKFILLIAWIAGIVIAEGGWKILAIFVPLYAWYLDVELILRHLGVI